MRRSDKAERRTTKANRHIEKDSVGAHGEAAALRWRAADRFNPKTGINERIAKTGRAAPTAAVMGPGASHRYSRELLTITASGSA